MNNITEPELDIEVSVELLEDNEKSMDIISGIYGHSSNAVTQIYIGRR